MGRTANWTVFTGASGSRAGLTSWKPSITKKSNTAADAGSHASGGVTRGTGKACKNALTATSSKRTFPDSLICIIARARVRARACKKNSLAHTNTYNSETHTHGHKSQQYASERGPCRCLERTARSSTAYSESASDPRRRLRRPVARSGTDQSCQEKVVVAVAWQPSQRPRLKSAGPASIGVSPFPKRYFVNITSKSFKRLLETHQEKPPQKKKPRCKGFVALDRGGQPRECYRCCIFGVVF